MGDASNNLPRVHAAANVVFLAVLLLGLPAVSLSGEKTTIATATAGGGKTREYVSYGFSSFADSFRATNLTVLKDAGIGQGALQITPDTLNQASYSLLNKSGRVLFSQPFKLWDRYHSNGVDGGNSSGSNPAYYTASFKTSFTINIYRPNNTVPGEGFAFLIAPSLDPPPPGSHSGFLGLTNETFNGDPSNHLVAIELDTVKQTYDPDSNHVGLDVNSVISIATSSLTPFGIEISPVNATNYTVWIDYDGAARRVWVYMAVAGRPKPVFAVLNASLDLAEVVLQHSYLGFSASTGTESYQLNCVLAWNMSVEKLADDTGDGSGIMPRWKLGLVAGVPALTLALVVAGLLAAVYVRKIRKVGGDSSEITGTLIMSLTGSPREFPYKELKKATNNFDEKMKLGQGGFGTVYKGVLPNDGDGGGVEVAVKKFSRASTKGQADFLWELSIINRLRHKHLVRLVGWSHKNGVLLLVYDYMPNGSLDKHLFGGAEQAILTWEQRYNIVAGVASALHYLHNEYDQKVVHRDLKASNIMLDSAFNARLGDFGLARALDTDKTSYTDLDLSGVPGTLGYIAPECFHTGKATRESDVHGFGAVVLEVACGRRPRCNVAGFSYLVDWVWKLYREGRILEAIDWRLAGDFVEADAERLLLLGLACSQPIPGDRPETQAVVQVLSRSVPPPKVPSFKPSFVWPAARTSDGGSNGEAVTSNQLTSTVMTSSSYYASSSGCTHNYASNGGHVSGEDVPMAPRSSGSQSSIIDTLE